jgi:ribosomal protein S18 acetylase RimI-like enzyme
MTISGGSLHQERTPGAGAGRADRRLGFRDTLSGMGAPSGRGTIVRRADPRDAGTLGALRRQLFDEIDHPNIDATAALAFTNAAIDAFDRGLRDGWCEAWLAEDGEGAVVGAAALLVSFRLPSPASMLEREGYLLSVYTAPEWRRRRVARDLVAAAVEYARANGLARIRLHATAEGRGVYRALGFVSRVDEMELLL